ncbi:PTS sugar transporter subunit IIA [Polyangium sp. 15x6]|uniref:PTS sugar transporter subunit IIA n=1 Tax=Polyangium sp. 15x6 TaxID=3042687 RepID=UPI00249AEDE0|nr:PTS sugar transporter subunit IIA [Polyangium sp. 15x6]MDI3290456.1 PTS sugar transporter subunit IIA [Polyangium sp. 15x6]
MGVLEILSADHVSVANEVEGVVRSKPEALRRIAELLARGLVPVTPVAEIERVLVERERLQSTGVGGGVAIPHGGLEGLDRHVGAVLLCPHPIDFDAIDRAPVGILFAVVGPKRAAGEHLKTLARVSRLLRDDEFRKRLLLAPSGADAFRIIAAEEGRGP